MLWCNNDIAVRSWPIHGYLCAKEWRWVYDRVPPAIIADFDVLAVPITPAPPLPVYAVCNFGGSWSMDIGFTTISLAYGTKILSSFISEAPTLIVPQTF